MVEVKVFNRWSVDGISVQDPGLKEYISLTPRFVPRTGARYAKNRFYKSRAFIIERLMNKLMIPGHRSKKHKITSYHCTGKAHTVYNIMEETLELIEKKTKQNPIAVVVKAVENAAAREGIISIEYGGARYPRAVECAPQRRVDLALRYIAQGAYSKSFNSKRGIASTLAEELINAFNQNPASNAIAKKLEVERQSDASR
ncbi:30S ribosomal protein S7 [Candidatus Woesearchaeota archaeon CG08_land_8_20_14_0_20_47_9]|nr:MAG: 30S ribosomal protein S7 [Candidatus Woesearchaeota archaeon CG1_02_47_18]PIO04363.1 MAG: 30S ribosomal protein S7 [Candidatus Woesearchaeota archaeon CG08_land_8_20_14_0_20_47_9]HII29570.1 30S ribosomal protein S7 [Candidatus Woesearchaeota archaeon]